MYESVPFNGHDLIGIGILSSELETVELTEHDTFAFDEGTQLTISNGNGVGNLDIKGYKFNLHRIQDGWLYLSINRGHGWQGVGSSPDYEDGYFVRIDVLTLEYEVHHYIGVALSSRIFLSFDRTTGVLSWLDVFNPELNGVLNSDNQTPKTATTNPLIFRELTAVGGIDWRVTLGDNGLPTLILESAYLSRLEVISFQPIR
jgi:hypothetical protein